MNKILADLQKIYDSLKEKRVLIIENLLRNANAYLKKISRKITESKSNRRKSGDSIHTEMFVVLKVKYFVKVQVYHGGTMTGKDIQT